MKLKLYPEYKNSGAPWLGAVPEHWVVLPGLSVLREKKVKNLGMQETQVLSLSYGKIVIKPPEKLHGLVPESFETYQIVDPGDIIIRPTDLQNDKVSLRVGQVKNRGIITSAYLCLQTRPAVTPDYSYLLLHTYDLLKIYYGMGSGLRQNLDYSDFKRIPIILPPKSEQKHIANYLENQTSLIADFIRNKERLIALLHEQKQAIINRTVTRGIDPDVRLKPSGIDWLEDVPEHWVVLPIKRIFSSMLYGTSESSGDEGNYRVLTMGHLQEGEVLVDNCGKLKSVPQELILEMYDLLFNRTNSKELVGKVGLFEGDADDNVTFASYLVRMRVNQKVFPHYANYLLNSVDFLSFARQYAIPSLHQSNLNPTRYGRLQVALPARDEQESILRYIRKRTSDIDDTITHTRRQIDLIREYRTRLIADVVTGKVDVRDIPVEDVQEDEALEEFVESREMEKALDSGEIQDAK